MVKLYDLTLKNNKLESIPNGTFEQMANLSTLRLDNNHFRNIPGNNICSLKRLGMLRIASNRISAIAFDECFSELRLLFRVDLSDNPITQLNPEDFYGLRNSRVSQLYLDKLRMKDLSNEAFKYVPHLEILNLNNNKLTTLPPDIFKHILNLRTLSLRGNKLVNIPYAAIAEQVHLGSLDLTQNHIRNNTLGPELRNMPYLKSLMMTENHLVSLSNNSFLSLNGSKEFSLLALQSTSLKMIEADAFLPLRFLKTLNLLENPLNASMLEQAFYGLRFSVNLTFLGLSSTNLTDISSSTFKYLVNTSIIKLRAQGCLITVLPSGAFKFLSKLTTLNLSGNKIHTIENNAFENMNALWSLDLSRNQLTSIPNGNHVGLNTTRHLDLQRNFIQGAVVQYAMRGYSQLQYLLLGENSIRRIAARAFKFNPTLLELNLVDNKIANLDTDAFAGLTNLIGLNLKGNNLYHFDVDIFTHTPNIQTLDLSGNSALTSIIKYDIAKLFKPMKNLTKLMLSSTRLNNLPNSTFQNLTELTILSLSSNQLSSWTPGLFRDQSKLKVLSLARNKLFTIHQDIILELNSLEQLDVSNNSFLCDCELLWFTNWIKSGVFVYLENLDKVMCGSPGRKRGKRLMDLRLNTECMSLTVYYACWLTLLGYATLVTVLTTTYRFRYYLKSVFYITFFMQ